MKDNRLNLKKKLIESVELSSKNKIVIQCLLPSITYIIDRILYKDFDRFKIDGDLEKKSLLLYSLIDVNDITNKFIDYSENFIPNSNQLLSIYLPNIDHQAELTLLFCDNYFLGFLYNFYNNKECIIRDQLIEYYLN